MSARIRRVEKDRKAAEPSHLEALVRFAERAYRRPLSAGERDDLLAFYRESREQDGLGHEDAIRDAVAGILLSPHFCFRIDAAQAGESIASADRLCPGQPAELLPLVEHARRGVAGTRRRRRSAPAGRAGRAGAADAPRRSGPRPGHGVRRQLAGLPPLRGAQRRRPRAVHRASPTSSARRCTRSRSASSSTSCGGTARCSTSWMPITRSSTRSWPSTTACPFRWRQGGTSGFAWTMRGDTGAAASCRCRCS